MSSIHHLPNYTSTVGSRKFLVALRYLLSPDDSSCCRLDGRFLALKPKVQKILRGSKAVFWLIVAIFVTWLVQIGN